MPNELNENLKIAREQRKLIHPQFIPYEKYRLQFKEDLFDDAWTGCLPLIDFLPSTHTINEEQIREMMVHFEQQYYKDQDALESILGEGHNLDYAQEGIEDTWGEYVDFLLQLCLQNPELHHLFTIETLESDPKN